MLFPTKKTEKGINKIERIGLSFGLSIAITSFLGLMLNYTPWGIWDTPIILSLFFFTEILGIIAFYRWKKTNQDQRFIVSLDTSLYKMKNKVDIVITFILVLSLVLATASIIYIIVTPTTKNPFTDFYILAENGNSTNYPHDILKGKNTSIILGLINHEYKTINYTIEIWLINISVIINESTQNNDTVYNHAWFMDKIIVPLNHTLITNNKSQMKNWVYNYTFTINTSGEYKLEFLLFQTPTYDYNNEIDYKDRIYSIINDSYRELHLWLNVH